MEIYRHAHTKFQLARMKICLGTYHTFAETYVLVPAMFGNFVHIMFGHSSIWPIRSFFSVMCCI